jgi:hypothetical protein
VLNVCSGSGTPDEAERHPKPPTTTLASLVLGSPARLQPLVHRRKLA